MKNGSRARNPRGPAVAYTSLAAAMLVLIATVALDAQQPPPPAIAEFAPQALEQIREAPPEQVGNVGPGGAPTAEPTTGPSVGPTSPTDDPPEVPRYRRCYGDPPRQTEDPQSPPCVPYWDPAQDNGGSTWPGVDRNEIRIAWPQTIEKPRDTFALERYFNMRFEFYGRKIRLIGFNPRGGVFGAVSASDMIADADFVRDELDAFASIAYVPRAGAEHHYYDRLARRGVLSVDSHASMRTEAHLARFSPYQWSYLPAFDVMMRNYGEFICKSLAGRPPRYAGAGIGGSNEPRVFGLVYNRAAEGSTPDRATLTSTMRDTCGASFAVQIEYTNAEQVALRLKSSNVTTVVCLCGAGYYVALMPEATKQVYFPEWLINSYHYLDYDSAAQSYPAEHQEHVLGITFHNKWLPQKEMPWYHAIKEAAPEYETGDDGYASAAYERYYELLLLASGIQMAGPNLTPETFRQGLYRATFPAPGSGRAPLWHPGGGFGPGDHSMVDDGTMIWYSQSERGYTTNVRRGTFCYVRRGLRYGVGQWPTGDPPFFEPPCK